MRGEFGVAEPEADCPVSLDTLGRLYRADPTLRHDMLADIPEERRARLALFCYSRSHLRDLALTVAASCEPTTLETMAGTIGQVLVSQAKGRVPSFGNVPVLPAGPPKMKISLGGTRA